MSKFLYVKKSDGQRIREERKEDKARDNNHRWPWRNKLNARQWRRQQMWSRRMQTAVRCENRCTHYDFEFPNRRTLAHEVADGRILCCHCAHDEGECAVCNALSCELNDHAECPECEAENKARSVRCGTCDECNDNGCVKCQPDVWFACPNHPEQRVQSDGWVPCPQCGAGMVEEGGAK